MSVLMNTDLPKLPRPKVGKVREIYDLGEDLLIVSTDRISAFDVVMSNGIPDKGAILNQMSAFWFEFLDDVCTNHFITLEDEIIRMCVPGWYSGLAGRSMLCFKAKPLAIECVARGYISGSLYKEYLAQGSKVHGLYLPTGLRESEKLEAPIFTPATKAETGHDQNISLKEAERIVGEEIAATVRDVTLRLYEKAAAHAATKGLILADTKFEFGITAEGDLILIDEALTPDSSRYWNASTYKVGSPQPSFDKQFLRDYLEQIGFNKQPPGPELPQDVVKNTRVKYIECFERITGRTFERSDA